MYLKIENPQGSLFFFILNAIFFNIKLKNMAFFVKTPEEDKEKRNKKCYNKNESKQNRQNNKYVGLFCTRFKITHR